MKVSIKRNTGFMGTASKVQIKVNGKKSASIIDHQEKKIEIPSYTALLKATQFGVKSNEIKVKDGDRIKLTATWISRFSFPLIMIITFFTILIPSLKYRFITIVSAGIIFTVLTLLIEGFHLEVLKENHNN